MTRSPPIRNYELVSPRQPRSGTVESHAQGDLKVEEVYASQAANDNTDAGGEIFRNVIRIVDAQCYHHTPESLESDCCPYHIIVTHEESLFCNLFAVLKYHSDKKCRE